MSGLRHGQASHWTSGWSWLEWSIVVTVCVLLGSLTVVNVRPRRHPVAAKPLDDHAQLDVEIFTAAGLRVIERKWTSQRKTILLFGDSLTERSFDSSDGGWGAVLAANYTRKADVVNRGTRGVRGVCMHVF